MYDLDIARVIYTFPEMQERIFFITGSNPSRSLRTRLSDFGSILSIGGGEFAEFLRGVVKLGVETGEVYFTNLERLPKFSASPKKPTDAQVRDLLVWGDVDQELLASDISTGARNYVIQRDCVDRIVDLIRKSSNCNIVLRSNVGNGKTLCADIIAHKLNTAAVEIFKIENRTKKLMEELPQVARVPGKKAFIIDNLGSNLVVEITRLSPPTVRASRRRHPPGLRTRV